MRFKSSLTKTCRETGLLCTTTSGAYCLFTRLCHRSRLVLSSYTRLLPLFLGLTNAQLNRIMLKSPNSDCIPAAWIAYCILMRRESPNGRQHRLPTVSGARDVFRLGIRLLKEKKRIITIITAVGCLTVNIYNSTKLLYKFHLPCHFSIGLAVLKWCLSLLQYFSLCDGHCQFGTVALIS